MTDIVWILESERGPAFGSNGVADSYLIPQNDIDIEPKELRGKRLWIVLRGNEDRLFKVIRIKKIERITDGYHTGDYLITPETLDSLKISGSYADGKRYVTTALQSLSLGVKELDDKIGNDLALLVKKCVQIKLVAPDQKLIDKIVFEPAGKNQQNLVKLALKAVISQLSLDQIWGSGTGEKLGAFANFAAALIKRTFPGEKITDLGKELNSLDPTHHLDIGIASLIEKKQKPRKPSVDIEFAEIDPEKIYSREFLKKELGNDEMEDTLYKTEMAEKLHQEMLKDISKFLIEQKIKPYQSESIDLMYTLNGYVNLFEIKSANANNIFSQAGKGAFQIGCYLNELSKFYKNIVSRIILLKTDNDDLETFVKEALARLNIIVLFYDPRKSWPERVQELPYKPD